MQHTKLEDTYRLLVAVPFLCTALLSGGCWPSIEEQILELTQVDTSESSEAVQRQIQAQQERLALDRANPTIVGELGILYELHGFPEEAVRAYTLASQFDPTESRWPYYRAILLAARFNVTEALEPMNQAIELNPQYAPMWVTKGEMLMDIGNSAAALPLVQHAQTLSDDPYLAIVRARAHFELGEFQQALASIEESGDLKSHPDVVPLKASILIKQGNRSLAREILDSVQPSPRTLLLVDPIAEYKARFSVENLSSLLADATALIRDMQLDSAFELLGVLYKQYPTNKHVLQMLSDTYELSNQPRLALNTLNEAISVHPEFYSLRTAAARILRAQGDHDEALTHLDAAIKFEPQLVWAYSHKAQILMEQRQWLTASAVLDQAIAIEQDDPDLYTHLGICMGFLNRWPEARNLFLIAISIDSTHVPSYINLARAHTFLSEEDSALEAIRMASQLGASREQLESLELQRNQIKNMQISVEKR